MMEFDRYVSEIEFSEPTEKDKDFSIRGIALNLGLIPSHQMMFEEDEVIKAIALYRRLAQEY